MFHYFIEVSIAWFLFLSIYYFWLRKETFFKSNRWYLIHSILLGLLLPLLKNIPFSFGNDAIVNAPIEFINVSTYSLANVVTANTAESQSIDFFSILQILYFIGVSILTLRLLYGLGKIYKLWATGEKIKKGNYTLVVIKSDHLPFSFFNNIFISQSFIEKKYIQKILEHELVHIKHKHTYDVFMVQLVSIIFWWNPLIYIFKKLIKETHEYLADAYATLDNDIKNYGHILLGQSSSGIELALTNQFFNSLLKKRIHMLNQKKSAGYKLSKYLLAIPILLFMVMLFSSNAIIDSKENLPFNLSPSYIETSYSDNPDIPKELIDALNEFKSKDVSQSEKMKDVNTLYLNLRHNYIEYDQFVIDELTEYFKTINLDLKIESGEGDSFTVCVSTLDRNGDPKTELEKEFGKLYEVSQVQGQVRKEKQAFEKLYSKYSSLYKDLTQLKSDFISIGCAYGMKLEFMENSSILMSFMYIVPKHNFEAWKKGEMPQYDEMVCGENAFPPPLNIFEEKREHPIYKLNDKEVAPPIDERFDPSIKHNLTVLDHDAAIEKYGKKGKHGAYEITQSNDAMGLEGPPNNILYIGIDNIIKVHGFKKDVNKLKTNIADEEEYVKINQISVDENVTSINIKALKPTPHNKPFKIKFEMEGTIIENEYSVKRLPDPKMSSDENVFLKDDSNNADKEVLRPLYFHEGVEIDMPKQAHLKLDGHIVHYLGKEAVEKFGEKAKHGAIDIIGSYTITEKDESLLDQINEFTYEENPSDTIIKPKEFNNVSEEVDDQGAKIDTPNAFTFEPNADTNNYKKEIKLSSKNNKDPLFVIDGEIVIKGSINNLDPKDIESVTIYKDAKAKEKYGEAGINGVVEIITKYKKKKERKRRKEAKKKKAEKQKAELNVAKIIDEVQIDAENETDIKSLATYNLSEEKGKDKISLTGDFDEYEFIFTRENQVLEESMPLKFKMAQNPVYNNRIEYEYWTDELTTIEAIVFDNAGRKVMKTDFTPTIKNGVASFDLIELESGVYYFQLNQVSQRVTKPFIVP
ncbi:MAG: T9SS type A sorting domain-containing protein [Bacteroidia bacterium]|nr:T9SS type A sorting domain-containing protein [Bacteroidia bacterium]